MTPSEAGSLLRMAGLEIMPVDVDALMRRTEGWPAGLYLAAPSLRDQADVHGALARFGGDDRVISDYLRDEVLSPLPAASISFLTRTSVLDHLSGPLCDEVLQRRGSGVTLRALDPARGRGRHGGARRRPAVGERSEVHG